MGRKRAPGQTEWQIQCGLRLAAASNVLAESQSEILRILELSGGRWSNYTTGERPADPFVTARFCDTFGCSMDWIYRGIATGLGDHREAIVREHRSLMREHGLHVA